MKRNESGPLPGLVASAVIVNILATVMVSDGWMLWIPTIATLFVVGSLMRPPRK